MKREGTSKLYFTQRIPADLKSRAIGMTLLVPVGDSLVPVKLSGKSVSVRVSLRTSDDTESKVRQGAIAAHLAKVWKGLREKARSLTQKEVTALAGEVYKSFTGALEDNPGDSAVWRKVQNDNRAALAGDYGRASLMVGTDARKAAALEERFGPFVDVALGRKAITVDEASRARLLQEVGRAMQEAAGRLERNASGDYSPDETGKRFPTWQAATAGVPATGGATSMTALFGAWSREAGAAGKAAHSTVKAYGQSLRNFARFIGHDDASRVTPDNVVAFKDARLAQINPRNGKPVSAKTVNDNDLTALKTVLGWAVKNHKLPSNPAAGITVAVAVPIRSRSKGFTDGEARAILTKARQYKPHGAEHPKTSAAKRWVPWLCAFTGARLGEMVQLRKQDLRKDGKVYVLRITPEAGTVKGRKYRDVPLHPQLVEEGFPAFVNGSPSGHLFITISKSSGWRGPWQAVKNRVSEFARAIVPDAQVAPSHGWRHRFITLSRANGVDQELRRMITGHRGEGVDEASYGDPAGLYREICKLPRYKIDR